MTNGYKSQTSHLISSPRLEENHVESFEKRGFTVLPNAFSADILQIGHWCDEMLRAPEVSGKHWVYWEKSLKQSDAKLVNRIERLAPFHDGFAELVSQLGELASQALKEPATLFKEKINFKLPGGNGFKPHQDSQAGWEKYAPYFLTILLSVDDATIENGCLEICDRPPNGHLFQEWEPLSDKDMNGMRFDPVQTRPGDVIIFDSYTPHRSAANLTDHSRRIYYATFNRAADGDHHDIYYQDKHKAFPPDIDRDPNREYIYRV